MEGKALPSRRQAVHLRTQKITWHMFNMLKHVTAMILAGEESLICRIFKNNSVIKATSEKTTRDGELGGNSEFATKSLKRSGIAAADAAH